MPTQLSLHSIDAILILRTSDGARLFAKYYAAPFHGAPGAAAESTAAPPSPFAHDVKAQRAFEAFLADRLAKRADVDVLMYENRVAQCKVESDVVIAVLGSEDSNEILLHQVLLAVRDALHLVLRQAVDARTILEHYDLVCLLADEICDDGVVLETDGTLVAIRVSRMPAADAGPVGRIDIMSEEGLSNLAELGKAKLVDWFRAM